MAEATHAEIDSSSDSLSSVSVPNEAIDAEVITLCILYAGVNVHVHMEERVVMTAPYA